MHQYDIVLDVSVINRTGETMQNVSLELATMGDLKLVERPQTYTLAPGAQKVGGWVVSGWGACFMTVRGPPAEAGAGRGRLGG